MSNKWLAYNCLLLVVLYYLAHCLLEQFTAEYKYSCSENSDDNRSEMYQPRGSLARTLYNKQLIDATLETMDQSQVSNFIISLMFCVFMNIILIIFFVFMLSMLFTLEVEG